MSKRSILLAAIFGITSVHAFAQKPIRCEFLVDGKVVGLPDANLDWGSGASTFTTDTGLTLTVALSGCTDACLNGAPFTALHARISKDGKVIARSYVSPVDAINLLLEAPAENAKIACQEVQATPPVVTEAESEQALDAPLMEQNGLVPLSALDLRTLELSSQQSGGNTTPAYPRATTHCRHSGISATTTPGFDLQPGENCLFQSSGVVMQLALEPLLNGKMRLTVTGAKPL